MPSRAAPPEPMLPRPFRVVQNHRETRDTVTLSLVPADGGAPAPFLPGQFNMLYVFGIGEAPISISGHPDEGEALVHTVRAVGAVSAALCNLRRGETVGVRGPFGSAWPVEAARGTDVVFVAGGIGLAPLRPAFLHVLARRREYGRVVLAYGARTPADLLFVREVERWRAEFGIMVRVTVDRADRDWFGAVGLVTRLLEHAEFDADTAVAFICGPEVMMKFSALGLEKRGMPAERILVSVERNMKCAIGFCGHCQLGPAFVCKDGPVFAYPRVEGLLGIREL